jgi:hypothetical protein
MEKLRKVGKKVEMIHQDSDDSSPPEGTSDMRIHPLGGYSASFNKAPGQA